MIGYLGMIGGLLALVVRGELFSGSPVVLGLQAMAVLLFLWARFTLGRRSYHVIADPTDGGLVAHGPYRFVRHPIYASMCLFTASGIAAHGSLGSAGWGVLIVGSAVMRIVSEEILVSARYPEYAEYQRRTWCFIPFIH